MEQFALDFVPQRRVFTLRELSDGIRASLERGFTNIWVSGEISGTKLVPSGHCYFTLKESDAQIKCVCWKLSYWRLKFKPADGVQVLVRGRIDIYEMRSEYQFVVEAIEPQGSGALQLAFDQLKLRLQREGLFDTARKRPMPLYPRRIGIVSSPKGAVIRDFVEILSRRFPGVHIRLFAARVQGLGSVDDICKGLTYFGTGGWAEVVVLARGGGSLEDLWTFNEEVVARAIAESPLPVISAIGHESDVTIADFVADLRAPTPSAAAEMIICSRRELLDRIQANRNRAAQCLRYRLSMLSRRLQDQAMGRAIPLVQRLIGRRLQRVDDAQERLRAAMRRRLADQSRRLQVLTDKVRWYDIRPRMARSRERLNDAGFRLGTSIRRLLTAQRRKVDNCRSSLESLNPRAVLSRGYAIVLDAEGRVVKQAAQAPEGMRVRMLFERDSVRALIEESPEVTAGEAGKE
ncbi:MAG: Exodeoxyribonuclease large subunit [Bryobacterales bacterium]|nr:Exodeoxyribonuclease large subunit [Bryobacterales bacterium]